MKRYMCMLIEEKLKKGAIANLHKHWEKFFFFSDFSFMRTFALFLFLPGLEAISL